MYGYTYLTYDTEKNKVYVGQHKSESYDEKYYGSGTIIRNIIKKRKDTLQNYVLEWCDTLEHLNESEMRWIEYFREEFGEENCYNLCDGGEGAKGCHPSEETRRKMSVAQKGRIITEENKRKVGEANRRRVWSEESRMKISESLRKRYTDVNERKKTSEAGKGRIVSEETRQKLRELNTGRHHTEETKNKIGEASKDRFKNKPHPFSKRVMNTESGQIWGTITDCASFYGVTNSNIRYWLKHNIHNLILL